MMGRMQAWGDDEGDNEGAGGDCRNNSNPNADYDRTNQRLMQIAGIHKDNINNGSRREGTKPDQVLIRSEMRAERRPSCDNASMSSQDDKRRKR
jgi:hypothetical protein